MPAFYPLRLSFGSDNLGAKTLELELLPGVLRVLKFSYGKKELVRSSLTSNLALGGDFQIWPAITSLMQKVEEKTSKEENCSDPELRSGYRVRRCAR